VVAANSIQQAGFTTGSAGSPPTVDSSTLADGDNTLSGSGTPGATILVVDGNGTVLGQATVQPDGSFTVPLTNVPTGGQMTVMQNGVPVATSVSLVAGDGQNAYLSANVYRPALDPPLAISMRATADGEVTVKIFNLAGELVQPLFKATVTTGRRFQAQWDGANQRGEKVASGVYFISVRGAGIHTIRKVIILK